MILFTWSNLVFFVPLALFLVLSSMYALGLAFDHDSGPNHDHHGAFEGFLESVGLGGAPLTIIIMPLLFSFGLSGLLFRSNDVSLGVSVALAIVSGFAVAWLIGRALRRIMPNNKPTASTKKELIGLSGKVHSGELNHSVGEVVVKDRFGHVLYVVCKLTPDEKHPLKEGEEVVLLEYDAEQNHYIASSLK